MLKEYIYRFKYHLTRSYVYAIVVISLFIYNGKIDVTNYFDIVLYFLVTWFAIDWLRSSLLGYDLIGDSTGIYSGDDEGEGIVDIVKNAELFLYIVSPFIKLGDNLLRTISDAQKNDVETVILVSRGKGLDKNALNELSKLQDRGCEVKTHPNLHSKIFLNEKVGIISSMNLHQGSITNSLEIGIRITNIAQRKEIEDIINGYLDDEDTKDFKTGYCIKTKTEIDFNVKKPIDKSQFSPNDMNNNLKYCHSCGKETETTVAEPLCDDCK